MYGPKPLDSTVEKSHRFFFSSSIVWKCKPPSVIRSSNCGS